jgi:hypothetical protein
MMADLEARVLGPDPDTEVARVRAQWRDWTESLREAAEDPEEQLRSYMARNLEVWEAQQAAERARLCDVARLD